MYAFTGVAVIQGQAVAPLRISTDGFPNSAPTKERLAPLDFKFQLKGSQILIQLKGDAKKNFDNDLENQYKFRYWRFIDLDG